MWSSTHKFSSPRYKFKLVEYSNFYRISLSFSFLFNIIISFRFAYSFFCKHHKKNEAKELLCRVVVYLMQGGLHTAKEWEKIVIVRRMEKLSYKSDTINLWFQCYNLMDEAFFIASRIKMLVIYSSLITVLLMISHNINWIIHFNLLDFFIQIFCLIPFRCWFFYSMKNPATATQARLAYFHTTMLSKWLGILCFTSFLKCKLIYYK